MDSPQLLTVPTDLQIMTAWLPRPRLAFATCLLELCQQHMVRFGMVEPCWRLEHRSGLPWPQKPQPICKTQLCDAASARQLTQQGRQVLASCLHIGNALPACMLLCRSSGIMGQKGRLTWLRGPRTSQSFSFIQPIGKRMHYRTGTGEKFAASWQTELSELKSKRRKQGLHLWHWSLPDILSDLG